MSRYFSIVHPASPVPLVSLWPGLQERWLEDQQEEQPQDPSVLYIDMMITEHRIPGLLAAFSSCSSLVLQW